MVKRVPPPTLAGPAPYPGNPLHPIEKDGRWQRFNQTLAEARDGFADLPPEAQQVLVDEATAAVRAEQWHPRVQPPREVLGPKDFTDADLAAIRAAEPPPVAPEDDVASPETWPGKP
jgi:hypothetical protein